MKRKTNITRRKFMASAATGLAFAYVPRHVLGGRGYQAPSEKLRVVAIGIGGVGQYFLRGCKDSIDVAALCDLDHNREGSQEVFQTYPNAIRYHDYREMFDKEVNNFDAVIIATPDHTHTMILLAALKLNKHIYCAKPITHTIGEARRVRKAVLEAKNIITKTSVQFSATDQSRSATELLNSGILGHIRELHIWCDHPQYPALVPRPTEKIDPPPGMNWDAWIGPAPYRPYHPAYHPAIWRSWWDFGSGAVGDMCCHTLHVYFKELQLGAPTTIYSSYTHQFNGFFNNRVQAPETQTYANMVTWQFPKRGNLPPMDVHWYDGGMKPHRPHELDEDLELMNMGLLFVGENGKLLSKFEGGSPYGDNRGISAGLLLPEHKFKNFEEPPKTLKRVNLENHYLEWVEACKTGKKTVCPIEFGCEMTEMGLLGALSLQTKRLIKWDADAMQVTNSSQANSLVYPPYREGWEI